MDLRKYDHLWQQDELSDVDIVLTSPQQSSSTQEAGTCKLAAFPGHSVLLSDSPFIKAQILRWQNKRQHEEAPGCPAEQTAAASPASTSSSTDRRRPQLVLTLEDADQQPAALAVLQALYYVQPGSELLLELSQEQQLQAVLLADMWQVPGADTAAATALSAAADGQLSETVTQKLLGMQAVLACLEPLLKKVLMSVFGDLEAVWADEALLKQLLGLPLHAMALLLSCDALKVASEDTVLCTARRFCKAQPDGQALEQLMPLIRCPHMSPPWLSALATSRVPVPERLLPHLSNLLIARSFKANVGVSARDLQGHFAGAPASWALPKRVVQPVSSVKVTWELSFAELRQAVQSCTADNPKVNIHSPHSTPPINGMQYGPVVGLRYKGAGSGCCVALYATARDIPRDLCWSYAFRIDIAGTRISKAVKPMVGIHFRGRHDAGLPPMVDGVDEVAWAAKGLPTSGTLPITLTVVAQSQY